MGTDLFQKYPKSCTFDGIRVLNLGCGFHKFTSKNVVNVDKFECCKPDVIHDLNVVPLPFESNSFDYVLASHVFEHLPNWWGCFEECVRVLKSGGTLDVWVPGSGSDSQLGYRDHVQMINRFSFYGVGNTGMSMANAWAFEHSKTPASALSLINMTRHMPTSKINRLLPESVKAWMCEHLRNIIVEENFKFRKNK